MIQQTINIAGIMEDSIVDGPGLRTAIFAQGCPRRCEGCHNPESWAFGTGTDMTVQDLFWRVKKNPLVRGVTFSGGEPFSQAEPFTELAKLLNDGLIYNDILEKTGASSATISTISPSPNTALPKNKLRRLCRV